MKYLLPLFLLLWACNKPIKSSVQSDKKNAPDSVSKPLIAPLAKTDIRRIFQEIPQDLLQSSLFPAPDLALRKKIISQQAENKNEYRDIVVDTVAQYLFYDKQMDDNKGILTTISAFSFGDASGELVAVELSLWSKSKVETENLYFLKRNPVGGYVDVNKSEILPIVRLQDFYKGDVANKIVTADHNYLPVLCYEIQRGENKIKVFLGEWFHEKETFKYKPDIDFIELVWKDSHFEKVAAF